MASEWGQPAPSGRWAAAERGDRDGADSTQTARRRGPRGVVWPQFMSANILAGIGFTVSLFITSADFDDPGQQASAKLGIVVASVLAAVLGYLALVVTSPSYEGTTSAADERAAAA